MQATLGQRLVRLPFKAVPKTAVIRILAGPNRGLRWIAGSLTHSCWIGTFETKTARLLARYVRPGMTAFDVGANAGYYTLMLAKSVGASGKVLAFEPEPENLAALRKHLDMNDIRNVEIIAAAASELAGRGYFAGSRALGHLDTSGVPVSTVRLDDYPTADLIKMDIEGGEIKAMEGAARILAERRTTWLVSLHDAAGFARLPALFEGSGYTLVWPTKETFIATPAS